MLIVRLVGKILRQRFVRFILAGGTSVVLNLSARALFSMFVSYEVAIVFAYFVGMATAWTLMRVLVFKTTNERADGEILRFFVVNMIGLLQVSVVSSVLVDQVDLIVNNIKISEAVAHLLGLISIVFTSYLLHSKFTYSSKSSETKR